MKTTKCRSRFDVLDKQQLSCFFLTGQLGQHSKGSSMEHPVNVGIIIGASVGGIVLIVGVIVAAGLIKQLIRYRF